MGLPRVLLVDDHKMFLEGLASILKTHCEMVGMAVNGEDAVAAAQGLQPDVIVMDVSMPVLNGLEATRRLQELKTQSKIILVSMHTDPAYAAAALEAGASGFVLKTHAASEIIFAIQEALQGRTHVSRRLSTAE